MLDGKKRYNCNDIIAEFKKLMIVPYIVNNLNTTPREHLKQIIIDEFSKHPSDKYYKMTSDWVKTTPIDILIRTALSECTFDKKIRG